MSVQNERLTPQKERTIPVNVQNGSFHKVNVHGFPVHSICAPFLHNHMRIRA